MTNYEQLGLFYLGRRYDLSTGTRLDEPVLYDSKDLVTHAVCVGMTGSGKTGLGIGLIEEAAIDGVPVLAIDPKGDLSNLLLTFPGLSAAEFLPWVPASDPGGPEATNRAAAAEADTWRAGLAEWGQGPDRIARLRMAADVRVYTPGSRAGTPLALLGALPAGATTEQEDLAARIGSAASSLLALAGIDEPGPQSRAHTLLSTILTTGSPGQADLPWLVQQIQRPSFERVGVLDLETFYPARERQDLALRFNSILASPGFDVWLSGEAPDIGRLLYTPEGRPRVAIISIAHLDDAQRMLVVALVLDAALDWTRRQSGTSSLRALLYMDEVFGYLPPVANPPSKTPLLTLLKQARAFGVGVVLATQNPVDLDYKALSNTGTWFLGKLQTERDKARVLDGLETLSSGADRAALDQTLSSLRKRVFLMHNVHEREPVIFETRWTLSYLRGPLTREELRRVTGDSRTAAPGTPPERPATTAATTAAAGAETVPSVSRPVLPAGVTELFLPSAESASGRYAGALYGAARVQYTDAKRGIDFTADVQATVPFANGAVPIDWDRAETTTVPATALVAAPPPPGPHAFDALPSAALTPASYARWQKDFAQWVGRTRSLVLQSAPSLKLVSKPGESERDFQLRVTHSAREARDAAVEKLRQRYAPKVQRLTAKLRTAEDAVAREQQQAQQQKLQSAVSIGTTLLGALMGRKAVSMSTLGRATTAARGVGRSMKEAQDIAHAEERVREVQAELKALETELAAEIATLEATATAAVPLDTIELKPKRGGVDVRLVSLVWKRS